MLRSINALANGLVCLGGTAFYVMLFTKIGNGVKQIDRFGRFSYYLIKCALAFVIAGALLNVLLLTIPPFTEVLMNVGFGLIFAWAAVWHGVKFGVVIGVRAIDKKTGTFRVPK
jgi:hypothetical protein